MEESTQQAFFKKLREEKFEELCGQRTDELIEEYEAEGYTEEEAVMKAGEEDVEAWARD